MKLYTNVACGAAISQQARTDYADNELKVFGSPAVNNPHVFHSLLTVAIRDILVSKV